MEQSLLKICHLFIHSIERVPKILIRPNFFGSMFWPLILKLKVNCVCLKINTTYKKKISGVMLTL